MAGHKIGHDAGAGSATPTDSDERIDALRAAIADALALGGEGADGLTSDVSNLYLMVLKGLVEAAHDHTSAILKLSEGMHVRSSKVLLRTLMESWFIARYVAADETGNRATSYIMIETRETKRFLDGLLRRAVEKPNEQTAVLASAGLISLEDLKDRIGRQERRITEARQHGVLPFPKIVDCAKDVGLESTYRSVYGYLLSAQVHARAGDTLRDLQTDPRERGDLDTVLITTLFLQVQMLTLASEHFGRPERESLADFEILLHKLNGKRAT